MNETNKSNPMNPVSTVRRIDIIEVANGFIADKPVIGDLPEAKDTHVFETPEALAAFVRKWASEGFEPKVEPCISATGFQFRPQVEPIPYVFGSGCYTGSYKPACP